MNKGGKRPGELGITGEFCGQHYATNLSSLRKKLFSGKILNTPMHLRERPVFTEKREKGAALMGTVSRGFTLHLVTPVNSCADKTWARKAGLGFPRTVRVAGVPQHDRSTGNL